MFKRSFTTLAFLAALGASAATAQDSTEPADTTPAAPERVVNGQRFGAWVVTCEALAVNETTCVLGQRLLRTQDNAFLAQMLAFWDAQGGKSYIAARVPTGAYLPAGFAMRPAETEGEDAVIDFTWQSCTPQLCEALIELDDETTAALSEGDGTIIASYRPTLLMDPVVFRFSIQGLADGLAALNPGEASASE